MVPDVVHDVVGVLDGGVGKCMCILPGIVYDPGARAIVADILKDVEDIEDIKDVEDLSLYQ